MTDTEKDIVAGEWHDSDATGEPGTDLEVQPEQDQDVLTLPEIEIPATREELESSALEEAELSVTLDALSEVDELTLADIRQLPGTEAFSDDELTEMAVEAGLLTAAEEIAQETKPGTQVARSWKAYGEDGKEIADLNKISAAAFLKAQFGYKAMNTEQRRTFDEIVRVAQLGHLRVDEVQRLMSDRATLAETNTQLVAQLTESNNMRAQWNAILSDQTGAKFVAAQEAYFKALANPPAPQTAVAPEVAEAKGYMWYQQNVLPALNKISQVYGVDVAQIDKYTQHLIAQEPKQLLNYERIRQIVNVMVPAALEELGYAAKDGAQVVPSVATKPGQQIIPAAQTKQNEMKLRAENANLRRQLSKQKVGRAPGSGNRGSIPAREQQPSDNLERLLEGKTAAEARDILRNLR